VELDKRKTKDQFVIKELKNTLRVRDSWLNYDIENEMNDYLNYLNSALEKNIDNQGKDNADFEKVFSSNSLERLFSLERNSNNNSGVVLAMTTNRTAILSKINFTFDYVIVDESSKCSLEDLIVVANVTKKMILIGDYMQLSPFNILNDETRKEFSSFMNEDDYLYLKDSKFYDLFDKTYRESIEKNQYIDNYNISLLKRQYRMRKDIYSLVSKVYDIHDGLSIETAVNDDQRSLIFIDVDGVEGKLDDDESSYNQAEVDFTSEIMDVLKDIGIKDNKVAFITGYKEQVSRINKIKNSKKLDYKVQIGTIDMFQGKEFDIVVLSMVRTERLGFMSEVRRLNVALSRGKKKLIVLGNKRRISKVLADELYRVNNEKDELRKKERISLLQNIIPHLLSYSTEFTGKSDNIKKLYDFLGDVNE
jgi:superfamily I DNA and/or RNA helicase